MKNIAIILAGGKGERFKNSVPKQFSKLAGRKVIEYTLDVFENNSIIDEILIVINPLLEDEMWEIVKKNYKKVSKIIKGGRSRFESTFYAIKSLEDKLTDNDNILIHDGVRPFVNDRIIYDCINALKNYNAVDTAIDSSDTIIKVNDLNIIEEIPNRKFLKRGQTPQAFKYGVLKKAYYKAIEYNIKEFTCDCSVVHNLLKEKIYVIKGDEKNIKITYPIDLYVAEKFIQMGITDKKEIENSLVNLKGKDILVFGSSSGIGKEIKTLAEEYQANVIGVSRKGGVDISDRNSLKKFLKKTNKDFDIVIISAGILVKKPFDLLTDDEIYNQIFTNYIGVINVAKEIKPYLIRKKGSFITFASSSYTRGRANYSIYSSTKAAVVNFTQALAEEWANNEIRVNCVSPERTLTPMRVKNFGYEDPQTLLDPKIVAKKTLELALSNKTGLVLEVRK